MKNIITSGVVMFAAANIFLNSWEYNAANPVVFAREVEQEEPQEVLIETKIDWTEERIIKEIRDTFTETPNTAVAVAKAESGVHLKPDAYNPEWHYDKNGNKICQGSYGLMQIACVHHISDPEALFDVEFNLQKAKEIYSEQGWSPWGGYSSGGYKKYL